MNKDQILTFLFGAGSAGSVVGAMMLWRIKKMWSNIDRIPELIKTTHSMDESVKGFSGELRALERVMYKNQTDIAITAQKVDAAFRHVDDLKDSIRELKI